MSWIVGTANTARPSNVDSIYEKNHAINAGRRIGQRQWKRWREGNTLHADTLSRLPLRIAAEGDSWFDYAQVLSHLASLLGTPIRNLSDNGDTAVEMAGERQLDELGRVLRQTEFAIGDKVVSVQFQALLLSAGGNDVVDAARGGLIQAFRDDACVEDIVKDDALDCALKAVSEAYEAIAERAVASCSGIRIFIHEYDFPQAIGQASRVFGKQIGPWYKPVLDCKYTSGAECPVDIATAVVHHVTSQLSKQIRTFAERNCAVTLVPTRETLTSRTDWKDELHPSESGAERIAKVFQAALLEGSLTQ